MITVTEGHRNPSPIWLSRHKPSDAVKALEAQLLQNNITTLKCLMVAMTTVYPPPPLNALGKRVCACTLVARCG